MTAHPSLPLFTDAYLADTVQLSTEEHGAYLLLLISMWRAPDQRLPDDDARLMRFVRAKTPKRWRELRAVLAPFFIIVNGFWTHRRIEKEFKFVSEKRAKQRAKSERRWQPNPPENNETGHATAYAAGHAPSPSPSDSLFPPERESTQRPKRRKPSVPFPEEEAFKLRCKQACAETRPDLDFEAVFRRFRNHAIQNDRRCVVWIAAFSNWIERERSDAASTGQQQHRSGAALEALREFIARDPEVD